MDFSDLGQKQIDSFFFPFLTHTHTHTPTHTHTAFVSSLAKGYVVWKYKIENGNL